MNASHKPSTVPVLLVASTFTSWCHVAGKDKICIIAKASVTQYIVNSPELTSVQDQTILSTQCVSEQVGVL